MLVHPLLHFVGELLLHRLAIAILAVEAVGDLSGFLGIIAQQKSQ